MMEASSWRFHRTFVMVSIACTALSSAAQNLGEPTGPPLDAASRTRVIETILKNLKATYVFPEVADKMQANIQERLRKREYDNIREGQKFAERLTRDLQEVGHDKHLEVYYSPAPMPKFTEPSAEAKEAMRQDLRKRGEAANWGFDKVERLRGNIGYLNFRFFLAPEFAGDTLASAMNFLAYTDALIIDLRDNGGGQPEMGALVSSYFFSGEPVHLHDLYWRPDNSTQQFWTLPYVSGKRYIGKAVYILTGKETLSAAEGFAYSLQSQKRALIVGETTGGYAHPGSTVWLDPHFSMVIPQGRTINAVTKTDWEGVGVKPDIPVSAARALPTAHLMALKKRREKETDNRRKDQLEEAIQAVQQELNVIKQK